jgi:hypothetical protein
MGVVFMITCIMPVCNFNLLSAPIISTVIMCYKHKTSPAFIDIETKHDANIKKSIKTCWGAFYSAIVAIFI